LRLSNEDAGDFAGGTFSELMRLQADFQTRLADETLRYLRAVQAAFLPRPPGTVTQPTIGMILAATASPGSQAQFALEIENRQRVHTQVTPALTPLVADNGATWFPAAQVEPVSALLAHNDVVEFRFILPVPIELAPGTYRGTLLLQGFRDNGVAIVVEINEEDTSTANGPAPTDVEEDADNLAAANVDDAEELQ
jgi:hypothetical protein